jgi:hypothetical protein
MKMEGERLKRCEQGGEICVSLLKSHQAGPGSPPLGPWLWSRQESHTQPKREQRTLPNGGPATLSGEPQRENRSLNIYSRLHPLVALQPTILF